MKYMLKLIFYSLVIVSHAYSLEYTLQDLGLEWYASSHGTGLTDSGMVVGKLKEQDKSCTDFVWTHEKGLILLNPKQATQYQKPLVNSLGQVFGLHWHKVNGWFQSYQEKNLYTFDLAAGFVNLQPPLDFKHEKIDLGFSPYLWEKKTPILLGCSNAGEALVEDSSGYRILKGQTYVPIEFPKDFVPSKLDQDGRIFLVNKSSNVKGFSAYLSSEDRSQLIIIDYFNDHPDQADDKSFTAALKGLAAGDVFGIIGGHKEFSKLVGFRWTFAKGFELLPNFIPVDGNNHGLMIGFGYFKKECCPEPAVWHEGKMQPLQDLLKSDLKTVTVVDVISVNDAGQILVVAKGTFGAHAFLLNPK